MAFKLSTHRAVTFPNDHPKVYFAHRTGEIDVTAVDERVSIVIGQDPLFDGIKQYITSHQWVGSDEAAQAFVRLQELISLAEQTYDKLHSQHGPKAAA